MIVVLYLCTRCGKRFELEVLEPGEAEAKRLSSSPVTCPECHSRHLERLRASRPVPNRPR